MGSEEVLIVAAASNRRRVARRRVSPRLAAHLLADRVSERRGYITYRGLGREAMMASLRSWYFGKTEFSRLAVSTS